jgi:hypothetical protein
MLAPATGSRAEYRAASVQGMDAEAGVKPLDSSYFDGLVEAARAHPRRRRMVDLTRDPSTNKLQNLVRCSSSTPGSVWWSAL